MFTLRFESDSRGDGPAIVWMAEAPTYRVIQRASDHDIGIPNEHGVYIYHTVNGEVGNYDRCFVMNSNGKTVGRFEPNQAREHTSGDPRAASVS